MTDAHHDQDDELPDYLVEAILSQVPPAADLDLVKNAMTWRTIDAELMDLSYDSSDDLAAVRDMSDQRSLEFTLSDLSVLLEVDGLHVAGVVSPALEGTVTRRQQERMHQVAAISSGRFVVELSSGGVVQLVIDLDGRVLELPAFAVS